MIADILTLQLSEQYWSLRLPTEPHNEFSVDTFIYF